MIVKSTGPCEEHQIFFSGIAIARRSSNYLSTQESLVKEKKVIQTKYYIFLIFQGGVLVKNITLFRHVIKSKDMKNISLPSSLKNFQQFYNKKSQVDPVAIMRGKTPKKPGWFNNSFLNELKTKSRTLDRMKLKLPTSLCGFEKFFNVRYKIDPSVLQYGFFRNKTGLLFPPV